MWAILGLIAVWFAVVLVRTLLFRPEPLPPAEPVEVTVNQQKIVADMVDMIRLKTVSYRDDGLTDKKEFEKFEQLLKERFPLLNKTASFRKIGKTGLLYHLKGQSDQAPTVLMAHYDVVPVNEEDWTRPAFDGLIEDGCIWGRGTLDTKGTLCGIVQAVETALEQGYTPKNDLYLAFSGEEEIDGDSCKDIVSFLEQKGVTPALVLDEGGAIVENVFPGVKQECALIGIAEKGGVNFDFTLRSSGGHASTPAPRSTLGRLSDAVARLEKHPFPAQLTLAAKGMFDILGRNSNFLFRMIFANLWCFFPVIDLIGRLTGGELNAMVRTTIAVTRMQGSDAYNVMPPKASFGINMRLLGKDTIESVKTRLQKTVKNDRIAISLVSGMEPSICSDTAAPGWDVICTAIRQTWSDTLISPYLMMACSDSRHYCRITDKVYRFSAMRLSKEERKMIHGNDERIPISTLLQTVAFYQRLLKLI